MGCSQKWTTLGFVAFLSIGAAVVCQNSNQIDDSKRDVTKLINNASAKSQLMNTLLTVASANGVLPDLLPSIQPTLQPDKVQQYYQTKDAQRLMNNAQIPSQKLQEPIIVTSNSPTVLPHSIAVTPCNPHIATPQIIKATPTQPSMYTVPQTTRCENVPVSYPSSGINQPIPVIWQYPANVRPDSSITPDIDCIQELPTIRPIIESINTDECQLPVNLQINLPAQTIPAPRVTVVSSAPSSTPSPPQNTQSPYAFPPFFAPPIVIQHSNSMKNWLPIILVALLANDNRNNGCNYYSPCNNYSDSPTPIPFPIPIPINSPIINVDRKPNNNKKHVQDNDSEEDSSSSEDEN